MASIKSSSQGQSEITEEKERGLQSAFIINLKIFKNSNKYQKYYWHFDLNSGNGFNDESKCIGSPLAFLYAVQNVNVDNYFAGFCDINEDTLKILIEREVVATNPKCFCFHGDNASLVEAIPDIISEAGDNPQYALGMVLSDPNGTQVPIKQLSKLSEVCPRLDLVINWNSVGVKRSIGAGFNVLSLGDAIRSLNKKHWLIREPKGRFQFVLLVGRNFKIGEHKALGFYHLDSLKGQDIFNTVAFIQGKKNRYAKVCDLLSIPQSLAV